MFRPHLLCYGNDCRPLYKWWKESVQRIQHRWKHFWDALYYRQNNTNTLALRLELDLVINSYFLPKFVVNSLISLSAKDDWIETGQVFLYGTHSIPFLFECEFFPYGCLISVEIGKINPFCARRRFFRKDRPYLKTLLLLYFLSCCNIMEMYN